MGKTRKDRRDRDPEFHKKDTRKEFSKKRKNQKFGRNLSSEDLLEEYSIDDDE